MSTPACIANAVADALGQRDVALPLTPLRVMNLIGFEDPAPSGSLLRYDYEANVSGKVAAVGSRMLEGAARVVLRQLFEQLGREAAGPGAAAPAPSLWQRLLRGWRRSR